ncbi:glycosyltransferase family 2 protein [Flavobacterium ponti]|uniref:Glycosyltransferase family 2 protein n=1 Tax=Flavobacterium ponti TaxID=665133 RepID=A0ABV9P2X9_9FLAO
MKNPLISIIIPAYNRAQLIRETLDSILAQTYENWECIIVDDGSTDNTEEVLKEYQASDNRFQFYKRPNDKLKGANACRNYGFQLSRGEYVGWFDSDDIMSVQKIDISMENLLTYEADLVVTKNNKTESFFDKQLLNLRIVETANFYKEYIVNRLSILTGDVIFKREVVENFEFDENMHKAQEFEFFTRVFNQNLKIAFTDSRLWYHRESADSISALASKMNLKQVNSLIYLSSKLQQNFSLEKDIVKEAKRNGRKLYKSIICKNKMAIFFNNYSFFAKCFSISHIEMFFWFLYNYLTKRGFDTLKKRAKRKQ